jgi:hypothetical protein
VLERKELFGDELLDLLNSQRITVPPFDYNDEAAWPPLNFSTQVGDRQRALTEGRAGGNGAPA